MSNNERLAYRDDRRGNCPECGRTNGYLSVVDKLWCYCREHKTKWFCEENYGWLDAYNRGEVTQEYWGDHRAILSEYRKVEPVFPLPEDPFEALDYIASRLGNEYKVLDAMELAIATFAVGEPTWEKYCVATFLDTLLGQLSARPRPPITRPIREGKNPFAADLDDEIPFWPKLRRARRAPAGRGDEGRRFRCDMTAKINAPL
jgi:hypothetical protein